MRTPNIVLVTIDTLRADRIGRERSGHLLTPNLSALGADGRAFTRAVAAGVPTYFGFPAIFRGGGALDYGKMIGIPPEATSFVERLRGSGYRTACVIASNPYLSRYYRYDAGFEIFDDFYARKLEGRSRRETRTSVRVTKRLAGNRMTARLRRTKRRWNDFRESMRGANPGLDENSRGELVTARGMSIIEELRGEGPFFLWLHYMDVHGYFYATQADRRAVLGVSGPIGDMALRLKRCRYVDLWTDQIARSQDLPPDEPVEHDERDRETLTGFYDAAALYLDRNLAPLLERVRRSGDTVIFVTSDHGEEFYDHGKIGHAPIALYEELARVPLLVFGPGVKKGEVSDWISHSSIPVSVLEAAGVDSDLPPAPSLLSGTPTQGAVFTEALFGVRAPFPRKRFDEYGLLLSCRMGRHKYVWREGDGNERLFDLEGDPGETVNLIGSPSVADVEQKLRGATRARSREIGVRDARSKLSASARALGRSMGLQ